jgi:polyisoprenoid-binding protein YceI
MLTQFRLAAGAAALAVVSVAAVAVEAQDPFTRIPAEVRSGSYVLDPSHSKVTWSVSHLGFSTYVGRFDRVDATLGFDPAAPAASRLEVLVETGSVNSRVPVLDGALRGPGWLDTAAHPRATFRSTAVEVTAPSAGRVTGDLTLRGVMRPVALDVTFNGGADNLLTGRYTLGFSATTTIRRSEFGITNLVPAVGDEVTLEIQGEFLRQ